MKVRALVKNNVMLILVDSGSSHNFLSSNFLNTVGMEAIPAEPKQVKLANGDNMITGHWVPQLEWWASGHTLSFDTKVLSLGAYDAILGYDWVKAHSPMMCNWQAKILELDHNGTHIKLQGVQPAAIFMQGISVDKVVKWATGNDIWALAVVHMLNQPSHQSDLRYVQHLLHQFQDVFQ